MHSTRLTFIVLALLTVLWQGWASAQTWDQPWSDPRDRPPRFDLNLTAGMGFIAVALVYFGGWRPWGILGGALLFSTVNALQLWMQVLGVKVSADVAVMLPYLLTIAALAISMNRARQPAGLNIPFERGTNDPGCSTLSLAEDM